ncbi:MAG: alpha/beta fold hydrolase [Burkholderiales bacterium]|nr:alpha/beta fold hydrolase [Burkholderiales bacterium]MBN8557226.1 alpha/beta fold hydrolase [Burkholderiales bacterium]
MNAQTRRLKLAGPAGDIEGAIDTPAGTVRGLALVCHPHPLHGGTMDNKVVQTLARALVQRGYEAVRFNFRGVGASAGAWDEGRGETADALAVLAACRQPGQALVLAGFSFGAYIAARVAASLPAEQAAERLVLVGPAASRFDMPAVPAGTLVIHGEADDVVPLADVLAWARPLSQPVTVVPGAGHFFHGQLPLLKTLVTGAAT